MSQDNSTTSKVNYNEWADRAVRLVAKNAMTHTGHRVVATPHILLGVLKGGPAANLLNRTFGVTTRDVIEIVENMPKPLPAGLGEGFLYSDGAREVLDKAGELAVEYGFRHGLIYTDHLLMALLVINDEPFAHVMGELGVDHEALMAKVTEELEWKVGLAKM